MIKQILVAGFLLINSCYSFVLPHPSIIKLKPVNNALIYLNHNRNIRTSIMLKKNNDDDFYDYKLYLMIFFLTLQIIKDLQTFELY